MLASFSGKKEKVFFLCSRPRQNVKLGTFTLLGSCSRAPTKKKCAKKRYVRAKLLFCQSKPEAYMLLYKPIPFLPFLVPSPSSSLKLPINTMLNRRR